jgi:hypothetical protein
LTIKFAEKLNEVYNGDYYRKYEPIANVRIESVRKTTKDDT